MKTCTQNPSAMQFKTECIPDMNIYNNQCTEYAYFHAARSQQSTTCKLAKTTQRMSLCVYLIVFAIACNQIDHAID